MAFTYVSYFMEKSAVLDFSIAYCMGFGSKGLTSPRPLGDPLGIDGDGWARGTRSRSLFDET